MLTPVRHDLSSQNIRQRSITSYLIVTAVKSQQQTSMAIQTAHNEYENEFSQYAWQKECSGCLRSSIGNTIIAARFLPNRDRSVCISDVYESIDRFKDLLKDAPCSL